MKFGLHCYYRLTPKKIKKVADSLLVACSTGSVLSIVKSHHTLGILAISVGVIAKFFSEYFEDDQAT